MLHIISVLMAMFTSVVAWLLISYCKNKQASQESPLYIPIKDESEEKHNR